MDSLHVPTGIAESKSLKQIMAEQSLAEESRIRKTMRVYPTHSRIKLILPLVTRGRILCARSAAARAS